MQGVHLKNKQILLTPLPPTQLLQTSSQSRSTLVCYIFRVHITFHLMKVSWCEMLKITGVDLQGSLLNLHSSFPSQVFPEITKNNFKYSLPFLGCSFSVGRTMSVYPCLKVPSPCHGRGVNTRGIWG